MFSCAYLSLPLPLSTLKGCPRQTAMVNSKPWSLSSHQGAWLCSKNHWEEKMDSLLKQVLERRELAHLPGRPKKSKGKCMKMMEKATTNKQGSFDAPVPCVVWYRVVNQKGFDFRHTHVHTHTHTHTTGLKAYFLLSRRSCRTSLGWMTIPQCCCLHLLHWPSVYEGEGCEVLPFQLWDHGLLYQAVLQESCQSCKSYVTLIILGTFYH